MQKKSLKTQIIVNIFLTSLLIAVIITFAFVFNTRNIMISEAEKMLGEISQKDASRIEGFLQRMDYYLLSMKTLIKTTVNPDQIEKDGITYLEEFEKPIKGLAAEYSRAIPEQINTYFHLNPYEFNLAYSLSLKYVNNQLVRAPRLALDYYFDNSSELDWLKLPIEQQKTVFSDPYHWEGLGDIISVVTPVIVGNKTIGVVGMDVSFDYVKSIITEPLIYETGYTFLANTDGKILVHRDFESGMMLGDLDKSLETAFMEAIQSDDDIFEYTLGGLKTISVIQHLSNDWILVETIPQREVLASLNDLMLFVLIITAITLIINSFVSLVLGRSIANPIKTLAQKITDFGHESLGSGSVTLSKPLMTNIDEINSISTAFHKMQVNIVDSYEELNALNKEIEASYLENQTLLNKMEAFMNVPDYLFYLKDTEKFLKRSFEKMISLVNAYDYGYVVFIENGVYKFLDFRGIDVKRMNRLKLSIDDYSRSEDKVIFYNHNANQYLRKYANIIELIDELTDEEKDIQQALVIPIASENHYYGSMTLLTKHFSDNQLTEEDYRIAVFFSNYLKGYLMIKELSEEEENIQKETIYSLIRLLEQHDAYTRGHSESVARLSSNFAHFIGLSEQTTQELYWAGIVHDMGKILIPHSILNKPTRLTNEEFDMIKQHPDYAYDILKDNKNMENIAIYIRHHHEKYDGSGYPCGLKGEAIPFESRVLTLADSWDAMTADRVYKKGIPTEDALKEIKRNAGIQFDPDLAEKWVEFIQTTKATQSHQAEKCNKVEYSSATILS